jgi:hypothetical protein
MHGVYRQAMEKPVSFQVFQFKNVYHTSAKTASPENLVLLQQPFETLNTIKPEQDELLGNRVN